MICIGLCLAIVLHLNQPNNLLEFYAIAHCFIFYFEYKTNHLAGVIAFLNEKALVDSSKYANEFNQRILGSCR